MSLVEIFLELKLTLIDERRSFCPKYLLFWKGYIVVVKRFVELKKFRIASFKFVRGMKCSSVN